MNIAYKDLRVTDPILKKELLKTVEQVLSHGRFLLGPEHDQFEKEIADACSRKYAVGVGSGTTALYLALRSLDIGEGDEVILPPLSWIATLNAVVLCGATPVFVDIAKDLNIDADLISEAITSKTKVILPVHFTGKLCNITKIMEIADQNNLLVVEDAAQAYGASINGRRAGSFGNLACFSMNPMKVLSAYGEAGMILTDDENLSQKLQSLRYLGTINKQDCHYPSINGRLDTLQAAMLQVNLKYVQSKLDRLREIAHYYTETLKGTVICPHEEPGSYHSYYSYTILVDRRDELTEFLKLKGIETKIQHPILMPNHTAYRTLPKYNIPVAEQVVEQIICIPNHEKLTDSEVEYVAKCIKYFYGGS